MFFFYILVFDEWKQMIFDVNMCAIKPNCYLVTFCANTIRACVREKDKQRVKENV